MKIQTLFLLVAISLTEAAYISRMTGSRPRPPTVFRPGVILQRPWTHQRILPASPHRSPYIYYKGPISHRYAMKLHSPHYRNVISSGPWKTGRLPLPSTTEYIRASAAPALPVIPSHGGTGAIHTIPAPNLSLSEKPIVVAEASESGTNSETASQSAKTSYEVTEKYTEPSGFQAPVKIESPIGFSKQSSLTTPELQQFIRNGAPYQIPTQYGASSLSISQHPLAPQQFSMPGFTEITDHRDQLPTAAEGIIIPQSGLEVQNDPNFLQNLHSHFIKQLPLIEFVPYESLTRLYQTPQPELSSVGNEENDKQAQPFDPIEHRNIVQRETKEGLIHSLIPQAFTAPNVTENFVNATAIEEQNVTLNSIITEVETSTPKHTVETTTEEQKSTPIYYAQVGQSVGNVIAKGFYSAINDVRAAAALAQDENLESKADNSSTTTLKPEARIAFDVNSLKDDNKTRNEVKKQEVKETNEIETVSTPLSESETPHIAYTLLKSPEEHPKLNKDGQVFAGQLVQAMVSEDREYNKKPNTVSWRPPLRLYAVTEKKIDNAPKVAAVKAKIPPKSKLTFDNKTGEPVLRVYASYSENPLQKEAVISKLTNMKHRGASRKDTDNTNVATGKSFDQPAPNDANQMGQFGLKLHSRSDDYIPLFEEYED